MRDYDILLYTPTGSYLRRINDILTLDMVRTENQIGTLTITVAAEKYPRHLFKTDTICDVMRLANNRQRLLGDTHFMLVDRHIGSRVTTLQFEDGIGLLNRRVVAYDEGDAQSTYEAVLADDAMKAIVDENMGQLATDADRDLSEWLEIESDYGLGPFISKSFSGRRVLEVLQEISKAALEAGTYVGFDVIANGPGKFMFRTYPDRRGADHTQESGIPPIIFSEKMGNITNVTLSEDHTNERNFIYANGPEQAGVRIKKTASDGFRIARSPFGRIEDWVMVQSVTDAAIEDDASVILGEGRPVVAFEGTAVQKSGCSFGIHYDFGDLVTGEAYGSGYKCRVKSFSLSLSGDGQEIAVALSNTDVPR